VRRKVCCRGMRSPRVVRGVPGRSDPFCHAFPPAWASKVASRERDRLGVIRASELGGAKRAYRVLCPRSPRRRQYYPKVKLPGLLRSAAPQDGKACVLSPFVLNPNRIACPNLFNGHLRAQEHTMKHCLQARQFRVFLFLEPSLPSMHTRFCISKNGQEILLAGLIKQSRARFLLSTGKVR
jgi:hypothetical protein